MSEQFTEGLRKLGVSDAELIDKRFSKFQDCQFVLRPTADDLKAQLKLAIPEEIHNETSPQEIVAVSVSEVSRFLINVPVGLEVRYGLIGKSHLDLDGTSSGEIDTLGSSPMSLFCFSRMDDWLRFSPWVPVVKGGHMRHETQEARKAHEFYELLGKEIQPMLKRFREAFPLFVQEKQINHSASLLDITESNLASLLVCEAKLIASGRIEEARMISNLSNLWLQGNYLWSWGYWDRGRGFAAYWASVQARKYWKPVWVVVVE